MATSIEDAKWIWIDNYDDTVDPGKFVLFRKTFIVKSLPSSEVLVRVSADTRYRMFINSHRASFGPCKSYLQRWYYECVDIQPYLVEGENVIAIRVLRFSQNHAGNSSMTRANIPGLVLQGTLGDIILDTNTTWKTIEDRSTKIVPRSEWNYALGPPFMSLNERCDGRHIESQWNQTGFDDEHWNSAIVKTARSMMLPILEPRKLFERPIPQLPEIEAQFQRTVKAEGQVQAIEFDQLLHQQTPVTISANTKVVIELQAEVLTTGFIRLACESGPGSVINIMYAESYERKHDRPGSIGAKRWKGDRTDWKNGILYGPDDEYITSQGENIYEPFWFSTFRFVRLTITTADSAMKLTSINFRETHYPLEIQTQLSQTCGLDKMWQISLNTLKNCMHETYEDCPFYEQNQFAMDTRAQVLFTYQLSRDDRLIRKSIHEFYASRREDGLIETHFPIPFRGFSIPQFSLYWIFMVYDHMWYHDDPKLVRRYIGTIDGILEHFTARIGSTGMVSRFDEEAWPFVDWVQQWHGDKGIKSMAIPPCYHRGEGIVAYNSLVFSMALLSAAELNEYLGRVDVGKEYRNLSSLLNSAVNRYCFDGTMYTDGPETTDKCQHTQVFAILSGAIEGVQAAELFRKTIESQDLPKCSYAMSFYLLRAASKVGLYEELFPTLMKPWQKMIADNLTTWAEDDVMFRSDCHGWSSSPIYEIVREIFGLSPASKGYDKIRIEPRFRLQERAQGSFVIKDGTVALSWGISQGLAITASRDIEAEVVINGVKSTCMLSASVEKRFDYMSKP